MRGSRPRGWQPRPVSGSGLFAGGGPGTATAALRGGDMALSNSNAQNFFRDLHPDIVTGLITDSEPPATIGEALEKSGGVTIIA